MNEHDLIDALEDHAADVPVGPAPLDTMTRSAGRARRRRGVLGGLAAAAAVAVVAVGVAVLPEGGGQDGTDPAAPAPPAAADSPPAGTTYVGLGRAAIAVPSDWPAGEVECNGTPTRSTWTVDVGRFTCYMYTPFPADTDAVTITSPPVDTTGWTPVEVDGADALRSPDEALEQGPVGGGGTIHGATLYLVEEDVAFRVQSSISAANVESLLDTVVVLDDHVGVPAYADIVVGKRERMDAVYLQRLDELGLLGEPVPLLDDIGLPVGTVATVDPVPGTVVDPGTTVEVTFRD